MNYSLFTELGAFHKSTCMAIPLSVYSAPPQHPVVTAPRLVLPFIV